MLKFIGISKRGRQQIRRHGDKWMPIQGSRQVGCLGGVAGIEIMSIKDRARFWIKVEGDQNLKPVERLDNFGNPIPRDRPTVPDTHETRIEAQLSATEPTITTAEAIKQRIDKLVITGAASGRTCASGGPNESANGHTADSQSASVADAAGTASEKDR